jgi:hypothetical protein
MRDDYDKGPHRSENALSLPLPHCFLRRNFAARNSHRFFAHANFEYRGGNQLCLCWFEKNVSSGCDCISCLAHFDPLVARLSYSRANASMTLYAEASRHLSQRRCFLPWYIWQPSNVIFNPMIANLIVGIYVTEKINTFKRFTIILI